jgi:hypothetical protein
LPNQNVASGVSTGGDVVQHAGMEPQASLSDSTQSKRPGAAIDAPPHVATCNSTDNSIEQKQHKRPRRRQGSPAALSPLSQASPRFAAAGDYNCQHPCWSGCLRLLDNGKFMKRNNNAKKEGEPAPSYTQRGSWLMAGNKLVLRWAEYAIENLVTHDGLTFTGWTHGAQVGSTQPGGKQFTMTRIDNRLHNVAVHQLPIAAHQLPVKAIGHGHLNGVVKVDFAGSNIPYPKPPMSCGRRLDPSMYPPNMLGEDRYGVVPSGGRSSVSAQ